jgi:hypothetical protein
MERRVIFEEESDNIPRLTRRQVAESLQVSVATVRRLEGSELHPEKNDKGVWTFDASEVARVVGLRSRKRRVKREDEGDVAARVFELLEQGYDLRDIVVALRVRPQIVRELYSEWVVDLRAGEGKRRQELLETKIARNLAAYR